MSSYQRPRESNAKTIVETDNISYKRLIFLGIIFLLIALLYNAFFEGSNDLEEETKKLQEWSEDPVYPWISSSICTVPRILASDLSRERFQREFLEKKPVIIIQDEAYSARNKDFTRATSRAAILSQLGDKEITLSMSNQKMYRNGRSTLRKYLEEMMQPQPLDRLGVESWYFFGDPFHKHWKDFCSQYEPPDKYMPQGAFKLSFGIGSTGSGIPFHTHGHLFAEVFYGKKRWWVSPPEYKPHYDPNQSSLQWLRYVSTTYSSKEQQHIKDCVCEPGDLLYIPSGWHHATLNIGETVFISVFL